MKRAIVLGGIVAALATAAPAAAQVTVGWDASAYSSYVWRGLTLSGKPVVQPDLYLTFPLGAASLTGGHHGSAHRIPSIHEGEGARCLCADPAHRSASGTNGREVHSNTAALLHCQRGFAKMFENAVEVVRDRPHDKAIEQGDRAPRTGAGDNSASGQKSEIGERRFKFRPPVPTCARGLRRADGACDARPCRLDRLVAHVARSEAIFRIPDFGRDWCVERHNVCSTF